MWSQTQLSATPYCSLPIVDHSYYSNFNHIHFPFKLSQIPRSSTKFKPSFLTARLRSSLQDNNDTSSTILQKTQLNDEVQKSVQVLKQAAKTRKVSKPEVLAALSVIEKAKLDPSEFLETLGGSKSPGRTWMLIFTAEKQLKGGRYFPITAIQRFDAQAKMIENGVFLGSLGSLTFEGRFSWKNRILAFIFERIRLKLGPFNPLEVGLGTKDNSEPDTKSPFFIWFYVDEEIAVARGRSGGTAFWCRCRQVANP